MRWEKLLALADDYLSFCINNEAYSGEVVREAVEKGDTLLLEAGNIEAAAAALRTKRLQKLGHPLEGALAPEVSACLTKEHAEYLKEMVEEGVPSRRYNERCRVKAKPHGSAMEHLEELYQKAWKDAKYGIVLFCSESAEAALTNLVESPQGRVPKLLPNRTISAEGRPIHDMRIPNLDNHKTEHPPANQAKHKQLARKSLWHKARHPGIKQKSAKLDVSRAFKWHDLKPDSVADFGTAMPGKPIGLSKIVKILYLAMTFGWCGSPGEYMVFADAAEAFHESYKPARPEGTTRCHTPQTG